MKFAKDMFLHLSVILVTGGWGCLDPDPRGGGWGIWLGGGSPGPHAGGSPGHIWGWVSKPTPGGVSRPIPRGTPSPHLGLSPGPHQGGRVDPSMH